MKILYSACWKEGLNTLIQRFQKLSQGFAGHRESGAVASALPESGACVPAWSELAPPAPTFVIWSVIGGSGLPARTVGRERAGWRDSGRSLRGWGEASPAAQLETVSFLAGSSLGQSEALQGGRTLQRARTLRPERLCAQPRPHQPPFLGTSREHPLIRGRREKPGFTTGRLAISRAREAQKDRERGLTLS